MDKTWDQEDLLSLPSDWIRVEAFGCDLEEIVNLVYQSLLTQKCLLVREFEMSNPYHSEGWKLNQQSIIVESWALLSSLKIC